MAYISTYIIPYQIQFLFPAPLFATLLDFFDPPCCRHTLGLTLYNLSAEVPGRVHEVGFFLVPQKVGVVVEIPRIDGNRTALSKQVEFSRTFITAVAGITHCRTTVLA